MSGVGNRWLLISALIVTLHMDSGRCEEPEKEDQAGVVAVLETAKDESARAQWGA